MQTPAENPKRGRPPGASSQRTELAALRCAIMPPVGQRIAALMAAPFMDGCSFATYQRMEAGTKTVPALVLERFRRSVEETNPRAAREIKKRFGKGS